MKVPPKLIGWPFAIMVMVLRWTCRVRLHGDDPRIALAERGENFLVAALHAHQIALILNSYRGVAAMVSRSRDGEMVQPLFRLIGMVAMRGSTCRDGLPALEEMAEHVREGIGPAAIAIDGPRGPRGRVRKGIAKLAKQTGAPIIATILVPRRRYVIARAWDRLQVPMPFTRIDAYVSQPIRPRPGESTESLRRRVEAALGELERRHDPSEARSETHLGEALKAAA